METKLRAHSQCGWLSMWCCGVLVRSLFRRINTFMSFIYILYFLSWNLSQTPAYRCVMLCMARRKKEKKALHHFHLFAMLYCIYCKWLLILRQPVYKPSNDVTNNIVNTGSCDVCICQCDRAQRTQSVPCIREKNANSVIGIRSSNLLKSCKLRILFRVTCFRSVSCMLSFLLRSFVFFAWIQDSSPHFFFVWFWAAFL